jgi:hypothetical protein
MGQRRLVLMGIAVFPWHVISMMVAIGIIGAIFYCTEIGE